MTLLAPSLLAANFANLSEDIKKVEVAGAHYLHLDIMDGRFVPNISFGVPIIKSIRPLTNMVFDCHLMIKRPSKYIQIFSEIGCDIITFHLEIEENIKKNISLVRKTGKKVGIAINPKIKIDWIFPYLEEIDQVTIMTVEAGFGGQKFIPKTLERIKAVKNYVSKKNLKLDIQADGGITLKNVKDVTKAGANIIVAGSSIFGTDDIEKSVKKFYDKF